MSFAATTPLPILLFIAVTAIAMFAADRVTEGV